MGVVDYVTVTVRSWYAALIKDITSCKSDEEVEAVVAKANAAIEAELKTVSEKTSQTTVSNEVSQQIVSTTEWAKGIVLEGSAKVKEVGVQIVASGGSDVESAQESLNALLESTEQQITAEYKKVDSSVTIEVEHDKVAVEDIHKVVKHDEKKAKKHEHKITQEQDSTVSAGKVAAGAVITVGVVGYVKSTVHSWFNKLMSDVAERAEKGGENTSADIEVIVAEATKKIDYEFSQVVHKTDEASDKESAGKLKATLEWANSMVAQTTTQVQAVVVQAIATGATSAEAIRDQLSSVVDSTTTQVDTALGSCKSDLVIEVESKVRVPFTKVI